MIYKMQRREFNNTSWEIQPFRSLYTSGSRLFKAERRAQDRTRDVCSFCCGKLSTVLHLPHPRWSWVPTAGQVLSGNITMLTFSIEADLNSASEARCVNLREKKKEKRDKPLQPAYGKSCGKSYQKNSKWRWKGDKNGGSRGVRHSL